MKKTVEFADELSSSSSGIDVIKSIVAGILEKKGEEISVLDVGDLAGYTDFFIIVSGNNFPQVQAIAESVSKRLKELGIKSSIEGFKTGTWVLIDAGNIIFHIFQKETRRFYALEDLWSDARKIEIFSEN
ncbi:ribosome silencing factor [bacterium]|nr:ribosome silencing factor [bacterium]